MNELAGAARSQISRLKNALRTFDASDGWAMSSHVALSLMISIFPFIIFTTALAGFIGNEKQSQELVDLVFEYWPDEIAEPITREIDIVLTNGNAGFLSMGIALALLFATNGVEAVRIALMRAYGDTETRPFWLRRLQSLAFVILGALLMSIISVLVVIAPLYLSFIEIASPTFYEQFFRSKFLTLATALLLLVFVVFACHYWLPVRNRPIARIWPGIAMTLFLWLISASIFSWYLAIFADYSATYAGLAGFMSAQIFLYLMAAVLIYGAEYNSELERVRDLRPDIS